MAGKRPNKAEVQSKDDKQPSKEQTTYFLSLSLENVRCFGPKQTLDLSDGKGRPAQWTILLGENGTGKTTVLQCLVALAPDREFYLNAGFWVPLGGKWRTDLSSISWARGSVDLPTVLKATIAYGCKLADLGGSFHDTYCSLNLDPRFIGSVSQTPSIAPLPPSPFGYGAARRLSSSALSEPESSDSTASLFSDKAELRNAEEWLLRLDYSASKASEHQQQQRQRLKQVKQLLLAILPEVEDVRFNPSGGVLPKPCVEFHTPYGWVPLRSLGYGYQTLIAWMVDFASRMVERYPDSADPLAEPVVVLVDEIDLHLHARWQRKLIGYLTEHFPNTQFIVTAHSPLVVQAAKGANIALLRREGDHVVIDNDLKAIRGWRIDQIYTSDLFGLESARPPELDEPLKRRIAILSKSKLTEADKRELKELEAQIGDLPVGETQEDIRTMQLLRESLDLLKEARKQAQ
jgi:predicted ATP-binding protein involved in virulence